MIPTQTFRYLACGGSNVVLNIGINFLAFNYILHKDKLYLPLGINIMPEVAAWLIAFSISFPVGFMLSRHIVFPESDLQGRVQLFRYAFTTVAFLIISYLLVRLFAYYVPDHPTISYTIIQAMIAVLSYISQRVFTFKTATAEAVPEVVAD